MKADNRAEEMSGLLQFMRANGILVSDAVGRAVFENPRHLFVPKELEKWAYLDTPLPTKGGQTISQPSTVVRMTELLDVKKGQKVLEIGTGSGWQAAILSTLLEDTGNVYTIESNEDLVAFSKSNLEKLGRTNVHIKIGDGSLGFPDASPYDRIIVTAAVPAIPSPLVEQLKAGGKMVIPIGKDAQEMLVVEKDETGGIRTRTEGSYVFVPLVGKEGFRSPGEEGVV